MIWQKDNHETTEWVYLRVSPSSHKEVIEFVALVVLRWVRFPSFFAPDWVRHCSGQRDHGHPGSGRQPGGHEKQTGTHGGGDQPLWTARYHRGPGVCYCVVFLFTQCGNFKPDRLAVGLLSLRCNLVGTSPIQGLVAPAYYIYLFIRLPVKKHNTWKTTHDNAWLIIVTSSHQFFCLIGVQILRHILRPAWLRVYECAHHILRVFILLNRHAL